MKQQSIKYESSCGKLIHYSIKNKTYRVINEKNSPLLSEENFKELETKLISNRNFAKKVNDYFREVKCEWEWKGNKYKKLPNFETNYLGGYNQKDIPRYNKGLIIVFHWGKLYYLGFHNSCDRGMLFDFYTKEFVQWVSPRNCAPVYSYKQRRII